MGKTKVRSAGATKSATNGKTSHKIQVLHVATAKSNVYSAEVNSQVDKIMSALNEANEIHSGRKKGTSFDEFLKEL